MNSETRPMTRLALTPTITPICADMCRTMTSTVLYQQPRKGNGKSTSIWGTNQESDAQLPCRQGRPTLACTRVHVQSSRALSQLPPRRPTCRFPANQARSARVPLRFAKHGSALRLRPQTSNQHFRSLLPMKGPRKEGHRRISRKLWMDGENAGTRVHSKDPSTFFLVWLPLRVDS